MVCRIHQILVFVMGYRLRDQNFYFSVSYLLSSYEVYNMIENSVFL